MAVATVEQLSSRTLLLDGAMGTMLMRNGVFNDSCLDLLSLTSPQIVANVHRNYLIAGADIITTNSINASPIGLSRYGLAGKAAQIAAGAARIARKEADVFGKLVAGSIGPLFRREAKEIAASYISQINALVDGGIDIILIETICDIPCAEIAVEAAKTILARRNVDLPLMLSTCKSHILNELCALAVAADAMAVGVNCVSADEAVEALKKIGPVSGIRLSAHPNAGNSSTPQSPQNFADTLMAGPIADIVGGCCGTTPAHIAALRQALQ